MEQYARGRHGLTAPCPQTGVQLGRGKARHARQRAQPAKGRCKNHGGLSTGQTPLRAGLRAVKEPGAGWLSIGMAQGPRDQGQLSEP
jgi:hypothetical protein